MIAAAIATRDFQDVHHDRDRAVERGGKDIFVNILTTTGLVQRYVTDLAGPEAMVRKIAIRLGVPCYAGDKLTFSGRGEWRGQECVVEVTGRCGLGDHVTGDGRHREDAVISGAAAIAGIGATEFSKDSGAASCGWPPRRPRPRCADAELAPADVDGLVTFTMDSTAEIALARELGVGELRFFSQVGYGGGAACAIVQQAAMAVATGIAQVVVCYRALNERSGRRFGQVSRAALQATSAGVDSWHYPMGLLTPAATVAMIARRYMHDYGATSEDFGRITVADRRHAAANPKPAFYQRPVTLTEHQASRWIVEPLRLLDCCQESDGAVAVVVTGIERARGLLQRPAGTSAAAQGSGPTHDDQLLPRRAGAAGDGRGGQAAVAAGGDRPQDVRAAVLYDHFTPYVLLQLEELGLCPRGEARHFISGGAIELDGVLPLNPHGGQLGEAYIHGMNGIAEAVRQIRGTSVNQVRGDGPVLVTAGPGCRPAV